jgi:hypothetical protein
MEMKLDIDLWGVEIELNTAKVEGTNAASEPEGGQEH